MSDQSVNRPGELPALQQKTITVPEWGGISVCVHEWSGDDRYQAMQAWDEYRERTKNAGHYAAFIVAKSAFTAGGVPMFTDVGKLAGSSGKALARVFAVASKLNLLDAADIAEIEKNCASGPSSGSGAA